MKTSGIGSQPLSWNQRLAVFALSVAVAGAVIVGLVAAAPAVPANKTAAVPKNAELTKDMQACLARSWFPIVFASVAKPQLHADDKGDSPSALWGKILDSCDVRPDEESAATDYVKALMKSAYPSGTPKAPEPEKKKPVQVCGPDRWRKDHWEPDCR